MPSLSNVLITDPVNPVCIKILEENDIQVTYKPKLPVADILQEIENYDGLIVRSGTKVTEEIINAATRMKIIGRAGTGVDNIDSDAATRKGIVVMNTPGGNTLSATEHTCAMIMSLSRDIPRACASLKSGCWERSKFMGNEVFGKTLAILGLGRIGREVAIRMQAFGMTTIGFDPIIPPEVSKEFGVESLSLEEIWPRADYITVHTPLIPQTANLINDAVFEKCRPNVRIINVARGGIIDEAALLRALDSGKCAGAALDVFSEEPPQDMTLVKHPRIVATPHLGANTHEAQTRVAEEIALQFIDFANDRDLIGVVNAPTLAVALRAENRPWVELGQSLGKIAAALSASHWKDDAEISVVTHGPNFHKLLDLLKSAVLVGILDHITKNCVNLINAPLLAKETALTVSGESEPTVEPDVSRTRALSVKISIGGFSLRVVGSVSGDVPFLCAIDGATFPGSVPLTGRLVFLQDAGDSSVSKCLDLLSGVALNALYCAAPVKSLWVASIPKTEMLPETVNAAADVVITPF